jgi:heme/copper-type cytochrome/quinol oxidase subunit 2
VNDQINFQNPATLVMDGVIDLHHDIMTFLIIIVVLVCYVLFSAVFNFGEVDSTGSRDFGKFGAVTRHVNHHAILEVV